MKPSTVCLAFSLVAAGSTSAATFAQTFTFPDGTQVFGDGSTSQSVNTAATAAVLGNQLRLTDAALTSTNASYTIPALANSSLGWTATFNFSITDTAGGNAPADGFSFNYGNMGLSTLPTGGAEEGWGAGSTYVAMMVDTWQNDNAADMPDVGIATNAGVVADQNGNILGDGTTVTGAATISYSPVNGVSFSTTGLLNNAAFTNVPVTGFVGSDAYNFAIGARTGGATITLLIDNVNITTVPEAGTFALMSLAGIGLLRRRRLA